MAEENIMVSELKIGSIRCRPINVYVLVACLFGFSFCGNEETVDLTIEEKNLEKITITTGLSGTLKSKKGNCMPMRDDDGNDVICSETAIQDTLIIHALTTRDQLFGEEVFYDSVGSREVAKVISDIDGFYEVALEEGGYSFFIVHNGRYFANSATGGFVNPAYVREDNVTIFHPVLDLAVYQGLRI